MSEGLLQCTVPQALTYLAVLQGIVWEKLFIKVYLWGKMLGDVTQVPSSL
jgi:hypothetical protein